PCTSGRRQGVCGVPRRAQKDALVRLCQAPIRRPKDRARLFVARVAISNRRLIALDERSVTFKVKDYRIEGPGRYTTMTLGIGEFIRRFLSHVLPKGFHRIRHYRLLARSNRTETMQTVRKLWNLAPPAAGATSDTDPAQPLAHPCPCCGGRMIIIETFEAGCQPRHRPTTPLAVFSIDTS